jgi:two-component system LytT family response regulator
MSLRVIIADDEVLARERIRSLLAREADVEVVAECRDGHETIAAVRRFRPQLLFLDVEMPEVDGFGVLHALGPDNLPVVIFTTAYNQYAVQAFEMHALDYLLKPFTQERFGAALRRARVHLEEDKGHDFAERLLTLLSDIQREPKALDRLVIKSGGRVIFLKAEEIDWVEAAANYVCLHVGKESHLLRDTMNSFEAKIDPQRFMRIHRSIIVNLEKIRALQPCNNGEYIVILENGKELSLSRSYRDRLEALLDRVSLPPAEKRNGRPLTCL